jgi:hypothetical protein
MFSRGRVGHMPRECDRQSPGFFFQSLALGPVTDNRQVLARKPPHRVDQLVKTLRPDEPSDVNDRRAYGPAPWLQLYAVGHDADSISQSIPNSAKTRPIELVKDLRCERIRLDEHAISSTEYVGDEQTEPRGSSHVILVSASHEYEAREAQLPSCLNTEESSRQRLVAHESVEPASHAADLPDSQCGVGDKPDAVQIRRTSGDQLDAGELQVCGVAVRASREENHIVPLGELYRHSYGLELSPTRSFAGQVGHQDADAEAPAHASSR